MGNKNKNAQLDFVRKGPLTPRPIPRDLEFIEEYWIKEPFLKVRIGRDAHRKILIYGIDEVVLTPQEINIYGRIVETLQYELKLPRTSVDPRMYFEENAARIVERYKMDVGETPNISWAKTLYFAERDMVGFSAIDVLMRDTTIEDISIDGVSKPVFLWHRKYESMETNLFFDNDQDLDDMISRLVHLGGKHISTAYPIVDGTLPGRHRLAATFRREVTPYGGTVTIRKFREDPVTIVDLLNYGTIDHRISAYAWLLMEHRASTIIVGSTASGKTTFLNAMLSMLRPASKIITIEEVQEINIPHENWISMLSRPSYGLSAEKIGEVSLFDLVKAAMRMRPDMLAVGEIRGEEAYVLFQAISTGHGGICTLHAEEVTSAMQRLTSKPMDVAPAYIAYLDLVFLVRRVALPAKEGGQQKYVRRLLAVDEVVKFGEYVRMFEWNPNTDTHTLNKDGFRASFKIKRLAKDLGKKIDDLVGELEKRVSVLKWLQEQGVRDHKKLAIVFEQYHHDPVSVLNAISEKSE